MSTAANVSAQESVMVPLARIPTDEGAQTRVRVRAAVVRDYAAAMKQQRAEGNLRFPPVILFTDGQNYWLGDTEWSQLSDREIGRRCQVDGKDVCRMRSSASAAKPQIEKRRVRRGDTVYEMKIKARDEPMAPATPPVPAATDSVGIPLPESRALVFTAHGDFRVAQDLFDRLSCVLDKIAQGPAGELYRQDMIRTADARLGQPI